MDPITQGVLGASLSQSVVSSKKHTAIAGLFGLLSGMAPDLDVFIRSDSDPLLFLEYHRQFTHSLLFIPVGSFICALLLYFLFGKRRGLTLARSWLYCGLGYATHAVLDTCTSYGTQLFWPFSDQRVAWNTMPIIDPVYTLPIMVYSGGDVVLDPGAQKIWFTMLLSAHVAKKPVNIYVGDSCTPVWANTSYANIGHVKLL